MSSSLVRFAPAGVLALGCLMISGLREQERMDPRTRMQAINFATPGYSQRDTTIEAQERKVAGMDDYVLRLFRRDSTEAEFSVYVGYYQLQVQGKTIHSPKNCLPGAGWEALNSSERSIAIGGESYPVNRYLLANKGAQALVYYWYQGRGRVEANEYKVKYNLMRDAALYGRTEEALVRIVVSIDPRDMQSLGPKATYAKADSLATTVAQSLIPRVTQALPVSPSA